MLNFPFAAVLMAGGQSRRMGYDKADASVAGEVLWRRQLALLRQLKPAELLISGRPGAIYPGADCPVITDITPGLGPLGGLATALRFTSMEFLLVLAVDMPAMEARLLEKLLISARDACRTVVPKGTAGFEPLAAVYHRASLPVAEECLEAGDRSMRSLIIRSQQQQLADIYMIPDDEMRLFQNVNTPEELRAAQAEGQNHSKQ